MSFLRTCVLTHCLFFLVGLAVGEHFQDKIIKNYEKSNAMVIKPIQALTSELTKEIMKKIGYQKMAEEYKKFVPKSELYKKLIIEDFTTGRPIVEIAKEVGLDQSSIRKALRKRGYLK